MRFLSQTRRLLATVCIVTLCIFAFSVKTNPVNNGTQDEDSSVAILSETLTANKGDPATDQSFTQSIANSTSFSSNKQSAGPDFPKLALANVDSKTSTRRSSTKGRVETSTLRGSTKTARMKSTHRRRNERSSSTTECKFTSVYLFQFLAHYVLYF